MPEDDFEIIRDEYIWNVDKFIKDSILKGVDPNVYHAEMYGSWVEKSEPKKIPVCAGTIHEKQMIMNRLCTIWMHQPTLTIGQLVSMQFSSMTDIFQAGDYDFIKAIESIRSLDHPKCETQLKKDHAIVAALRNTLEKLSGSIDAIESALNMFAQEEGEE